MGKRFAISRLSALGDVVCSLPAASALKQAFPDCRITWIVDPRFAGIVECCDAVDEVVKAKPGFRRETWPKIEGEFEAAIDLQGLLKSGIALSNVKASDRVGYHWQREGAWLFTAPVTPDPTSLHIVDQYVDVVRALGAECSRADFQLRPSPEDIQSVREKLGVVKKFVALNAGAGWVTKRWPPSHFAALADQLAALGMQCVLLGGVAQADMDAADEVIRAAKNPPLSLVGKTTVKELVALISLSTAHVGGDTGSTHIAAALNKPAIGLYSITNPLRSCPYGQIENCLHEPESLSMISPVQVMKKLEVALA